MAKALYMHIPFCDQICSYCDFAKVLSKGQDFDAYLSALMIEIDIYRQKIAINDAPPQLDTIYIGGGTPTVLNISQLESLFTYLHASFDCSNLLEFSIEANPESITDAKKIACLKKYGVTRVSLGVQTFHDDHLATLNRSHRQKDILRAIDMLATAGFDINIDLIYAIPHQTLAQWQKDLQLLLTLPITHVSAYSLILETHTLFYQQFLKDQLMIVDNEVEAKMFEMTIEMLTSAGFDHYEISNFTKKKPSHHNLTYWQNQPYIGVGLGAHGHLNKTASQAIRYENTRSMTAYKKALESGELPILAQHTLTSLTQIEEAMFLGLRLMAGVNLKQLSETYQTDVPALYQEKIDKLLALGYISYDEFAPSHIKLTAKGLMMANDVFEAFLLDT